MPLKGRRTSSKFGFHDAEPEVRDAIRAAIALVEWRGRVLWSATNFVTAMQSNNRFGVPQAVKNIDRAVAAADKGNLKRARIRTAAETLAAVRAAKGK